MIQELEKIRKDGLKKFGLVALISLGCTLILLPFMMFGVDGLMFGFFMAVIINVIVISCAYGYFKKAYVDAYKNQCLKEMLSQTFDEVSVNFDEGFSEEQIQSWHLVPLYDRFHSNDYISGKLNGIPFECSDIHIDDVVRSGKTTTVVTRFQGIYLRVPLKKKFSGWLVVREKEFLDNGNPRGWFSEMPVLEKIQVEDELFNQNFSIYGSDGQEAFYLLTPRFLEEIKRIEASYEGRCLFGFLNGYLHVAVDSRKEHFELGLFDQVNEILLSGHRQEMNMIKGILEYVKKECE